MVKGKDKMKVLNPDQNEIYKFLGCEEGDKIDVRKIVERLKKEMQKQIESTSEDESILNLYPVTNACVGKRRWSLGIEEL